MIRTEWFSRRNSVFGNIRIGSNRPECHSGSRRQIDKTWFLSCISDWKLDIWDILEPIYLGWVISDNCRSLYRLGLIRYICEVFLLVSCVHSSQPIIKLTFPIILTTDELLVFDWLAQCNFGQFLLVVVFLYRNAVKRSIYLLLVLRLWHLLCTRPRAAVGAWNTTFYKCISVKWIRMRNEALLKLLGIRIFVRYSFWTDLFKYLIICLPIWY